MAPRAPIMGVCGVRIPGTISSIGCSELKRRTTAIGKQFQMLWFSNRWEWRVWKGCRWTNKSRLVTTKESIWSNLDDKKVPVKLKSKLYKTVVRPAMVYRSECWALPKQEEQRLHTTEMKMLRWSQGKSRKDRLKNETIR